jgi:predicted dehydrogenase
VQSNHGWKSAVLIGAGRMGRSHALALREMGVSLRAVCDVSAEARARVGEEFGVAEGNRVSRPEELAEAIRGADVVAIATTADSHRALVTLAAENGARNILCEKPLATSVADCDAMIRACEKSGTRLAVNHQMRFMDQYLLVRDVLADGAIGRLASMTVVAGCFGLAMNGSHYIEAFAFLTGSAPAQAAGWFSGAAFQNPRGPQFFDQAGEFRIVSESGQRLLMVIGADQGHGMTTMYAGEFGHVFVDELEGEAIVTTRKPEHRGQPMTRYGMPWDRRSVRFPQADNVKPTRAVYEALAAGAGYPSGADGRRVIAALAACYASAENGGGTVALESIPDAAARSFPWA